MKLLPMALLVLIYGCTTTSSNHFEIFDKNVLGATFQVCASKIQWDGVQFTISGLNNDSSNSKTFNIGKIDYRVAQVRELDTLALTIDSMFVQMCSSTIALRDHPDALAQYVISRDKTALKLFDLLREFEVINVSGLAPESAIEKQKQAMSAIQN